MRSRATGAVWAFVVLGALVAAVAYGAAVLVQGPGPEPSAPSMVGGMGDAGGRRGSSGGER